MRQKTLSVQCENILPIIKKWLYSSHDIFLRELISNSCDAIKKFSFLTDSKESLEIHVRIDKEKKTLTISDQGIGMTEEEVEKYIAQIAFSGAEEFLSKYKNQESMIGHFGLGFYSAYMVAAKVELETLSYLPDSEPVRWSCDGSANYEIGKGTRTERGTDVILHLDEPYFEFLEEPKVHELLNRFCSFMPDPIFLNGKPLGNKAPLWLKAPSECTDQDYISFYRTLFPMEGDPLFWIHLNIDYPFLLKGILYVPKIRRRNYEENGDSIRLFCNRVYVSESCRDLLPDYLMMLRGAIDSADLPLNVSRSYLQVDQNVKQLGSHISKKVSDRLSALFRSDRAQYCSLWSELELLVKLGLLQDDKFYERTKDLLIWKTSAGDWSTVQEVLDRSKEKKIYYSGEDASVSLQKAFLDKGCELLYTHSAIDGAVITSLERKMSSVKFQRIDSALEDVLVDSSREKSLLDSEGKTQSSRIAHFFKSQLSDEQQLEVEAKSLSADSLPGVLFLDEDSRRLRDYMALTQEKAPFESLEKKTFVVNTNNKLVQLAWSLSGKKPHLAQDLARQIYDLSRLAQRELSAKEVDLMVSREQSLLEQLASMIP